MRNAKDLFQNSAFAEGLGDGELTRDAAQRALPFISLNEMAALHNRMTMLGQALPEDRVENEDEAAEKALAQRLAPRTGVAFEEPGSGARAPVHRVAWAGIAGLVAAGAAYALIFAMPPAGETAAFVETIKTSDVNEKTPAQRLSPSLAAMFPVPNGMDKSPSAAVIADSTPETNRPESAQWAETVAMYRLLVGQQAADMMPTDRQALLARLEAWQAKKAP